MKHTRRRVLRRVSALLAATVGASTTATAETGIPSTWNTDTAYNGGDRVTWQGYIWEAKWWNYNAEPGESGVWIQVRPVDTGNGDTDNTAPTAVIDINSSTVQVGETVRVDASGSTDGDGSITNYTWSFGDGTTATGQTASHSYDSIGEYTVTLTVTDDDGASDMAMSSITVESTDGGGGGVTGVDRIVGYYMQWSQWEREYYPDDILYDKISHMNYAFLTVKRDGSVDYIAENAAMNLFDPQAWKEYDGFNAMTEQHPDVTFLFSVGGWSDSKYFSNAAQTQANREQFANTAIEIMRRHNFDGLDIDWEYPGGGGKPGNIVRDGDQERFTLLLKEVREQLDQAEQEDGQEYALSAAVSADSAKVKGLEHAEIKQYLDYVNVMTYDYHGSWNEYTNHQAPLYSNPNDPSPNADTFYIDASMDYWASTAFDKADLSIGLPFYARGFANVTSSQNGGLYQPFSGVPSGTWNAGTGVYDFWDINQNYVTNPAYEQHWDDIAKGAWLYSSSDDIMISYDSPQSIGLKTDYAQQNGYGGLMFWAFSGDKNEVLLDTIHDHL
jgi:chitinase